MDGSPVYSSRFPEAGKGTGGRRKRSWFILMGTKIQLGGRNKFWYTIVQ